MKHDNIEAKYWDTTERGIRSLEQDILNAISHLEDYEDFDLQVAIAQIVAPDRVGRYIPQTLFNMVMEFESEVDYPYEIGSEEEMWAFDELLEKIDEELQMVVEYYHLVPSGYGVQFGWFDGEICVLVHTVS